MELWTVVLKLTTWCWYWVQVRSRSSTYRLAKVLPSRGENKDCKASLLVLVPTFGPQQTCFKRNAAGYNQLVATFGPQTRLWTCQGQHFKSVFWISFGQNIIVVETQNLCPNSLLFALLVKALNECWSSWICRDWSFLPVAKTKVKVCGRCQFHFDWTMLALFMVQPMPTLLASGVRALWIYFLKCVAWLAVVQLLACLWGEKS